MNTYDIYKYARDTAWRFLIINNVSSLPLDLSSICKSNSFKVLFDNSNIFLSGNDRGVAFNQNGECNIVLNAQDSIQVRRYTMAHEIGHIYLNHPMTDSKYGRTFGIQGIPKTDIEYQAERFAIDILAPACVLWGLGLHDPEDIAKTCNISIQSATYRANRMKILYERDKFLTHPLERKVYGQFRSWVENR